MHRKNFNWTKADQQYYETYQAPATGVTLTDLHTQLVDATGDYSQAAAIERSILKQHADHAAVMTAMQEAIAAAREARENVTAALQSEDTVTVDNGFTKDQEQAVKAQSEQVYGKVRASRAGQAFPRRDLSGLDGLFPNAYSEKKYAELEQARAFFA